MKRLALILPPLAAALFCTSCGLRPLGGPNPLDSNAHVAGKPRHWDGLRFHRETQNIP